MTVDPSEGLGYTGGTPKPDGREPPGCDEGTRSMGFPHTPMISGLAAEVKKIPVATGVANSGDRGRSIGVES